MAYLILRFYQDPAKDTEIVTTVATLEEAQEHCNNPETSSSTATSDEARERTRQFGAWFEGYTER